MSETDIETHDEFFDSLIGDFLDESDQLLESLNDNLLELETWVASLTGGTPARCDEELMNELFRAAHSFKGLSAMLGLTEINHLTHNVENVFDAVRSEQLQLTTDSMELVFESIDCLEGMVASLKDDSLTAVDSEPSLKKIEALLVENNIHKKQATQAEVEAVTAPSDELSFDDLDELLNVNSASSAKEETLNEEEDASHSTAQSADTVNSYTEQNYFEGIEDETEVPAKYLSIFIDESEMSIDTLIETLEEIEYPVSLEAISELLVTSHRMKGSAASVGLMRPAKLAHLIEDVLQDARENGKQLTEPIISAMTRCVDGLREYIEGLKEGNPHSAEFNEYANELMASCQEGKAAPEKDDSLIESDSEPAGNSANCDSTAKGDTTEPPRTPQKPESTAPESLEEDETNTFRQGALENVDPNTTGLFGTVYWQPDVILPGMKAQLVLAKLQSKGKLIACEPSENELEVLEEPVPFQFCVEGSLEIEATKRLLNVGGVDHVLLEDWHSPASSNKQMNSSEKMAVNNDEMPVTPTEIQAASAPSKQAVSANTVQPMNSKQPLPQSKASPKKQQKKPVTKKVKPTETLRVEIERLDQLMNMAGQLVINKARFSKLGDNIKSQLGNKQVSQITSRAQGTLEKIVTELSQSTLEQSDNSVTGGNPLEAESAARTTLNNIQSHVRQLSLDFESISSELANLNAARGSVSDLFEAIHQLDRVADGIQKSVMDTRMVPVGPLFNRFKRVIRDISRGNGKKIDLVIRGEKTELDKRMIDELGDPLIHMVRNSADHGIELPEQRIAAGKPEHGQVTLEAFHRGNTIVIEVRDDGHGIDLERVKEKALSKNIVSEADLEQMTNQQIYQLIWQPGFTTAEKVTDVSGRGMGMDIVRAKIEELNGTVLLDSEPGVGSTFTIRLPLTMAILPSLMFRVDGEVFAMPLESVTEIVNVPRKDFSTVQGTLAARVRGRVLSVIDIATTYSWNRPAPKVNKEQRDSQGESTIIIVHDQNQEVGIVVDGLIGEEDIVIKSLADNYCNIEGIAGASILGDGSVALIMDIAAVMQLARNHPDST